MDANVCHVCQVQRRYGFPLPSITRNKRAERIGGEHCLSQSAVIARAVVVSTGEHLPEAEAQH